ncbi:MULTISPECIES: hypothetical protein [unclassified Streptomyces]|uniref:hypothetical protein n=1 Tax=unclassified Streptomyces TaxID=2593676 RepID=UPI00224CD2EE|nr:MULTISPECIES: hypothetical protein [unclassified Streptomyces]MCX4526431.1 hypothetical protein [Streptomyces sp. NBC_01551]MCX4543006.1 hypothetical protein [Streptomyces sp. NBC_01565]
MTDWLAGGHPDPGQAYAEWAERGVAVIPVGATFGAVRLPEAVVHAAVGSTDRDDVGFALADRLDGPVIHDGRGRNYYALIRPDAHINWRTAATGVERLAPRTHLGVPAMSRCEYAPHTPIYWAVPGVRPGHCDPASIALLVRVGVARLEESR